MSNNPNDAGWQNALTVMDDAGFFGGSVEGEVLDVMLDADLQAALAELSDGVRTAMYYVAVQGYTYAETATLMDVPMGTVMSRVSRGRRRLRITLSHLDPLARI